MRAIITSISDVDLPSGAIDIKIQIYPHKHFITSDLTKERIKELHLENVNQREQLIKLHLGKCEIIQK